MVETQWAWTDFMEDIFPKSIKKLNLSRTQLKQRPNNIILKSFIIIKLFIIIIKLNDIQVKIGVYKK